MILAQRVIWGFKIPLASLETFYKWFKFTRLVSLICLVPSCALSVKAALGFYHLIIAPGSLITAGDKGNLHVG